ncbi:TPR Domain containing protein [Brugia malayi]|uniref:TPR Domain containing protein n=1 Tax=Brugia malayi TaxID=6279 RepID=A0A4E9FGQ7_BRUMA|nr:TPR Domain containing protein [Brugia malayi]VIO95429.1 TPR Domain containing protein [Brugia malayi]
MSPPPTATSRRHRYRLSSPNYHHDRANEQTNGFSGHSRENDLDVKCGDFLPEDAVEKLLNDDSTILSAIYDGFPVFECFATEISSTDAKRKLYNDLRIGDELCFRIRRVELAGVYAEPICMLHSFRRSLRWINDFQVLLGRNLQSGRDYRPNDLIKVLVVGFDDETKIPVFAIDEDAGLLTEAELPTYFRNGEKTGTKTFDEYLKDYLPATNPNLAALFGVETDLAISFLHELKDTDFSSKHRAPYIRRRQNEDLSMSVAKRGVDRIREGENAAAVQHFNKALSICGKNIEALVGRAAAYANMGQYNLAETDLDEALAINASHTNARNYMIETLLQEAKRLEEVGKKGEAKVKYEKSLTIKSDVRALDGLRNLERSPSVEIIKMKNDDAKAKDRKAEHSRAADEKQRRKRRRDAEKLAEYERELFSLEVIMITEQIEVGRCLCIHAQLQAVDIVLQSLLYQRGIVPAVVTQLLSTVESHDEIKFFETYTKIREALRELFRSCNRRALHEIIIIIGASCAIPQEIYRIPIKVCDSFESDLSHCGQNCAELSSREQRRISSLLVISPNLNTARNITRNTRVCVLVRGTSALKFPEELVENDDGFALPEGKVLARRKTYSVQFVLKHLCVEDVVVVSDPDTTWFRLSPIIQAFS